MYIRYDDILHRIPEPPLWWLNGVPRYDPFAPQDVEVYSSQVALVRSECTCGARYDVGIHSTHHGWTLRDRLAFWARIGVGDPPNVECCQGGASDSAYEIAILQFWERDLSVIPGVDWHRVLEMEQPLRDVNERGDTGLIAPVPLVDRLRAENLEQRYDDYRAKQDRAGLIRLFKHFERERAEPLADLVLERYREFGL